MSASRLLRRAAFAVCLSALAAIGYGQAPQVKEFQPEVGQPGKDVVWVPTPEELVNKMLDLAKVTPRDYVIDLGSGDGRTVIAAAKRGARALGIEYNPDMVELSKRNAARESIGNRVVFMKADLFETDFSQASVITMFLLPDINLKLRPKILDLKPGTRIVSNTFTMGDWKADASNSITENCDNWCTALLWIVPAKIAGTWGLAQGELQITQAFQEFSGTLNTGGKSTTIADGKIRGDEISFTAGDAQYTGRVAGNAISGTFKSGGATSNWRAARSTQTQGSSLPTFEVDRTWPKVPSQWKLGDASSIAIDAKDNVWVLHRPRTLKPEQAAMAAPPVIVFDTAGNYIKAWGGSGNGYEWPEREHGIHIDYKGFVWLGGNNCPTNGLPGLKHVADDQLLKFTQDGKLVMQIGRSNQSKGNADTRNLHRPADAWVYPQTNELFVADGYGNHRIAVFDAETGAFKRMWGAFGNKPMDDDHCQIVTPSSFSDPGPQQFSIVHAIRVSKDGTVYVADREYRRVQMFTRDGKFLKQLVRTDIPFARDLALSPDPNQQFLYVGGDKGIFIVDRKTLEIVGSIQPPGIIGPGHQIAVDSKGNLYIAQTTAGLQKLTFKGK